jgi:hypothetical protein
VTAPAEQTDRERRNPNCGGEKTGEPEEAMKLLRNVKVGWKEGGRRERVLRVNPSQSGWY